MKNLIFLLSLTALMFMINTDQASAQKRAHDIAINSTQDVDSVYAMVSETASGKYRQGKYKSVNLINNYHQFVGYRDYTAILTQASTNAPTATIIHNSLAAGTPVITRDSIGHYKLTKTAAFTANKTFPILTIGNAAGFEGQAYRQSDSTLIVVILSKAGIGVDLAGTAALKIQVHP